MKIDESPKAGWGILRPDPELSPETLALIQQLRALPHGQQHALLTQAVPRYLDLELRLEEGKAPDASQMVRCSSALSNWWMDVLGYR